MALRQVEIQARSVEDAVRLALEQMGRTREQVDIEVLSGDEAEDEVLVRVTAREQLSGPKERERLGAGTAPPPQRPMSPPPPREPIRADREERPERSERPDRFERGGRGDRYDRGGRDNRGPRADYDRPAREAEPVLPGLIEIDETLAPPASPEEANFATPADAVAPIAAEILQKLLVGMRFRGRISRHEPEDEAGVMFEGDDPAVVLNVTGISEQDQHLLIGRRGESLTAIQFMVNLLLGAQTDLWARVIVDVNGYRVRRREALTLLARKMADRVIEQGQPYPLEPMSPYDRRLVHIALSDHPQVMTESTGEGDERRVVIMLRTRQSSETRA